MRSSSVCSAHLEQTTDDLAGARRCCGRLTSQEARRTDDKPKAVGFDRRLLNKQKTARKLASSEVKVSSVCGCVPKDGTGCQSKSPGAMRLEAKRARSLFATGDNQNGIRCSL